MNAYQIPGKAVRLVVAGRVRADEAARARPGLPPIASVCTAFLIPCDAPMSKSSVHDWPPSRLTFTWTCPSGGLPAAPARR